MAKPTPGPFKAEQGGIDNDEPERWNVLTEAGWFVATIENGAPGDTLETEEANAHLFAAAPELFAELDGILAALEEGETVVIDPRTVKANSIARAIAKARPQPSASPRLGG